MMTVNRDYRRCFRYSVGPTSLDAPAKQDLSLACAKMCSNRLVLDSKVFRLLVPASRRSRLASRSARINSTHVGLLGPLSEIFGQMVLFSFLSGPGKSSFCLWFLVSPVFCKRRLFDFSCVFRPSSGHLSSDCRPAGAFQNYRRSGRTCVLSSDLLRELPIPFKEPPWPNGQGVGLLIRRLRARVPQGVFVRNPIGYG